MSKRGDAVVALSALAHIDPSVPSNAELADAVIDALRALWQADIAAALAQKTGRAEAALQPTTEPRCWRRSCLHTYSSHCTSDGHCAVEDCGCLIFADVYLPEGRCCENGDFGDGHECQKQPPQPDEPGPPRGGEDEVRRLRERVMGKVADYGHACAGADAKDHWDECERRLTELLTLTAAEARRKALEDVEAAIDAERRASRDGEDSVAYGINRCWRRVRALLEAK